jgi:hypothetical protein
LRALCDLCKNIDAEFSIMKDNCEYLNPFGAEVRYPNELVPDEPMVKAAIERAQKIFDFCTAKVNAL